MNQIDIDHLGLEYDDKENAIRFFNEICSLKILKTYRLSKEISKNIFSIPKSIEVLVFKNHHMYIEVFITGEKQTKSFFHICLKVPNKKDFISLCKKNGLQPYSIQKDDKILLFVHDFTGILYEIKEDNSIKS